MQESVASITRKQRLVVAVTAVGVALSRLIALSKTPWDWDEVLFCLAVQEYEVTAHQPHPPGFPLYIALARMARWITDTDFHALQAVNLVAAMLVFPVVFWLARSFRFDFHGSLAAAILFSFLPNVWYHGGTAFSDVPAMVLFLAAIAAYMHSGNRVDARLYLAASLLLAAGMLIRPQNAVVAAFPWAVATYRLVRGKRFGAVIGCNMLVVALVAAGYGIAAYDCGFQAYVDSVRSHSKFVKEADSFRNAARPPLWRVLLTQLDPYDAGKVSLFLNVLVLAALIRGARNRVLEVALTFLPFFVFALFTVNPAGSSRFGLNFMAGFVLLAVEGAAVIAALVGRRYSPRAAFAVRVAVIAAIALRFATWTLPALETTRTTVAPPVAAAQWLQDHVPTTSVVFVDETVWPWVRYFAPGHKQVRPGNPANIVSSPEAKGGWYIANAPTKARDAIMFVRPRGRISNLVVKRSFEAFVQPAGSVAHFGAGWHGIEGDMTHSWRWGEQLSFVVLGPIEGKAELQLKFALPLKNLEPPLHVTFTFNGQRLATVPIVEAENEVRFVVDARGDAPNLLRIDVSDSFVPAEAGSHDHRELALMLYDYTWRKL